MNITALDSVFPVRWNEVSALWFEIRLNGLKKCLSEADQCRANAALLADRILYITEERLEFALSELESGSEDGTVPDTAVFLVGIAEEDEKEFSEILEEIQRELREEYAGSHKELRISMEKKEPQTLPALHPVDLQKAVLYMFQLPDGVQKMSGIRKDQVDSFCHLSRTVLLPDGLHYRIMVGSTVESAGRTLTDKICYLTEFLGGEVYLQED